MSCVIAKAKKAEHMLDHTPTATPTFSLLSGVSAGEAWLVCALTFTNHFWGIHSSVASLTGSGLSAPIQ